MKSHDLINIDQFKVSKFNMIGSNSKVSGTFNFHGPTVIWGEVQGEINIIDGSLLIEKNAKVEAEIHCENIEVGGFFKGKIKASGTISLLPGALVEGILDGLHLSIYPGAQAEIEAHTIKEDRLL